MNLFENISSVSLLEDLRSPNVHDKLNAIKNLDGIIFALGTQKAKEELFPLLNESIEDEDGDYCKCLIELSTKWITTDSEMGCQDEFFSLVKQVARFDASNKRPYIKESFAKITESKIEKNLQKLKEIIDELKAIGSLPCLQAVLVGYLLLYSKSNTENKSKILRELFILSKSSFVNFKVTFLSEISTFMKILKADELIGFLTNVLFEAQPIVLKQSIDLVLEIVKNYSLSDFDELIVRTLLTAADSTNEVKLCLSKQLGALTEGVKNEKINLSIIQIFNQFIIEQDKEIRKETINQLTFLIRDLQNENYRLQILSNLHFLKGETEVEIKERIASKLLKACAFLGKQQISQFILPVIVALLDENISGIQLKILKKIHLVAKAIDMKSFIEENKEIIRELVEDSSWRVRIEMTEVIANLSNTIVGI